MKSINSTQGEKEVKFPKCSLFENCIPIIKIEKVESYHTAILYQFPTVAIEMYIWVELWPLNDLPQYTVCIAYVNSA